MYHKIEFNEQLFQSELLKLSVTEINWDIFQSLGSTNQKLWELMPQRSKIPHVVIACEQTAGRGQWGRTWQSLPGGLYLSLGINTDIEAKNAAQLTMISGWGIATSLRNHQIPVWLKWPNDLILNGRKLGGIKIETRLKQGIIHYVVIGVGINWTNAVPEKGMNLQQFTNAVNSLEKLAALTIYGLLLAYNQYLSAKFEIIWSSYLELLDSKGRRVMVKGSPGEVVGVTPSGQLRVRLSSLEIFLDPGEISIGYDD